MQAYQFGDEIAFQKLYERHSGRVLSYLRAKVRDESLSRDIFQATFLKLHKSRSQYKVKFPFLAWLFTICRSELLDALKKNRSNKQDYHADLGKISDSAQTFTSATNETSPAFDLSSLSEVQRQTLEMRFQKDFSFEEIANALSTSPANVRQILSRAVKKLRGLYDKK